MYTKNSIKFVENLKKKLKREKNKKKIKQKMNKKILNLVSSPFMYYYFCVCLPASCFYALRNLISYLFHQFYFGL